MTSRKIFASLLLSFVALATSMCTAPQEAEPKSGDAANQVIENIMTRTSIRAYTDEAVTDSMVNIMLKAAMAAPTAVNKQPWRFVVIKQREILDSIAANIGSMRMAAQAPLAIVVCGDMEATLQGDGQAYWIQDTSAATENLLLAAHALGLGAVWCGVTPMAERMQYISTLLGLPESILPLNVIVIGHPAESPQPKDKWKPENVHYDRW